MGKPWLALLKRSIWVVTDGAYATKNVLKPATLLGMTVVSRLRKDVALQTVPGPRPSGKQGRPRTYGPAEIDLAKEAGQRRGWSTETLTLVRGCHGQEVQSVLGDVATGRGSDPVVLVDEPYGWCVLLH